MQNNEISVAGSSIASGANKDAFLYKKAFTEASQVFQKYKFSSADSKDSFLKML